MENESISVIRMSGLKNDRKGGENFKGPYYGGSSFKNQKDQITAALGSDFNSRKNWNGNAVSPLATTRRSHEGEKWYFWIGG